jgi:membrane-associated phospholipid phosphatase
MLSYLAFSALFTLATLVGLVVGLYVFANFKNLKLRDMITGIKENWKFIFVLALILVAIVIENKTHDFVYGAIGKDYTHAIYSLSFNGAIEEAIQTGLRCVAADWFFICIYLYSFTFVLFFTPLLYSIRNDKPRMKQYTLALVINYAILIPFYLFFAVRTPGFYELTSPHMEPVLYSHPNLLRIINVVDPLDNCFPSGHVSVPLTIVLLLLPIRKNIEYRRFAYFMTTLTVLIILSVLYLGIHWTADIVSGILLAIIAVWIARKPGVMAWLDDKMSKLLSKFKRKKDVKDSFFEN